MLSHAMEVSFVGCWIFLQVFVDEFSCETGYCFKLVIVRERLQERVYWWGPERLMEEEDVFTRG